MRQRGQGWCWCRGLRSIRSTSRSRASGWTRAWRIGSCTLRTPTVSAAKAPGRPDRWSPSRRPPSRRIPTGLWTVYSIARPMARGSRNPSSSGCFPRAAGPWTPFARPPTRCVAGSAATSCATSSTATSTTPMSACTGATFAPSRKGRAARTCAGRPTIFRWRRWRGARARRGIAARRKCACRGGSTPITPAIPTCPSFAA
jgi:hypothetical protein